MQALIKDFSAKKARDTDAVQYAALPPSRSAGEIS